MEEKEINLSRYHSVRRPRWLLRGTCFDSFVLGFALWPLPQKPLDTFGISHWTALGTPAHIKWSISGETMKSRRVRPISTLKSPRFYLHSGRFEYGPVCLIRSTLFCFLNTGRAQIPSRRIHHVPLRCGASSATTAAAVDVCNVCGEPRPVDGSV